MTEVSHPVSVRYVYYRILDQHALFDAPIVKGDNGYGRVQDYLSQMRLSGELPFYWITDDSRSHYPVVRFTDADAWARYYADSYREDPWVRSEYRLEVWAESRSIAGMIRYTCDRLAVGLFPCNGQPSLTYGYNAAQEIAASGKRRIRIIYIGDHDKSGYEIQEQVRPKISQHLPDDYDIELTRIAVTEDQIQEHHLPTKGGKDGADTTEVESLPVEILRGLIRDEVHQFVDQEALAAVDRESAAVRETLKRLPFQRVLDQTRGHHRPSRVLLPSQLGKTEPPIE